MESEIVGFCKRRIFMAKAEYRSALRSRKLINEALADILQEKPLDKITVTEVVARAGINRGTFYAHYADIPDVIQHLIQDTFAKIRTVISQKPEQLQMLPELLLSRIMEILMEDMDFYRKVMASSTAPLMQEQLVEFVIQYLLDQEELYALGNHRQYELTIRFCAGGLSNLYRDWFFGKLDMPLEELNAQGARMIRGVLNQALTNPVK